MTNKAAWGADEHDEFDRLVGDALSVDASTSARAQVFREGIEDAIQAQRPWAREVQQDALKRGYLAIYKQEARKGTVLVEVRGVQIEKPSQVSVRKTSAEGVPLYQLAFYEVMTREQVHEKRREYIKQIRAYDSNVALMDKLTAMLDAADTDDLETAAAKLGVSVEDWISGARAA